MYRSVSIGHRDKKKIASLEDDRNKLSYMILDVMRIKEAVHFVSLCF